ncbi:hypothetical protein Hanom_Chr15g01354931 [Helianthus anomalus]
MFSTSSSLVTVINASKSSFGNWYFTHISVVPECNLITIAYFKVDYHANMNLYCI